MRCWLCRSAGPTQLWLCLGHSLCQLSEAPELGCSGPNAGKAGAKCVGLYICMTFHRAQPDACCLRPLRVYVHMSAFCDWLLSVWLSVYICIYVMCVCTCASTYWECKLSLATVRGWGHGVTASVQS